jgi:hypothetical protein
MGILGRFIFSRLAARFTVDLMVRRVIGQRFLWHRSAVIVGSLRQTSFATLRAIAANQVPNFAVSGALTAGEGYAPLDTSLERPNSQWFGSLHP